MCNVLRKGSLQKLKVLIATKYLKPTESDACKDSELDAKNIYSAQTTKCIPYDFDYNGTYFQVVDTPGLADTRGVTQDEANIANILNFCSNMDYLDCIVIVVNGTQPRFDVCMKTVCQRFRGNLPNTVLNTISVAFTNCTPMTRTFPVEVLQANLLGPKTPLNPKNIFYFQNMSFSTDPKTWTKETVREELQPAWDKSTKAMGNFLVHVANCSPTPTKEFKVMRDSREMLKSKMADVLGEVHKLDVVRQKIEQANILQLRAQNDTLLFSNFIVQEQLTVFETVDTVSHNTSCTVHQVTCHEQCGLDEIKTPGDPAFANCGCFYEGNGSCTICIQGSNIKFCGVQNHYHDTKKWVAKQTTVEHVLNDLKHKYDNAIDEVKNQTNARTQAEKELLGLEDMLGLLMAEIEGMCLKLQTICSGFNLAAELGCIIQTWEWQLTVITDLKIKNNLEKRITHIKTVINKLSGVNAYGRNNNNEVF